MKAFRLALPPLVLAAIGCSVSAQDSGSAGGTASQLSGSQLSGSSAAAPTSGRTTLAGAVPPWAKASNHAGDAADSDPVHVRVYLSWSDPAGAASLAQAVSDPSSTQYGHYLTPAAFRQRFAPTAASVNAVQSWLTSQGFAIVHVPSNGHYVAAEATVAQATAAFGTTLAKYTVSGKTLRAPASAPSIPSTLAGIVKSVVGLDQSSALVHTNLVHDPNAPPTPAFVNAEPCSTYWAEKTATGFSNPYGANALPYTPCGYTAAQIRGAYGVPSQYDGKGQTVAVIDAFASPTIQQDLDAWSAARGMASTKISQVVTPGTYHAPEAGIVQDPQGWYGEETLDIEAVHGMAPAANIVYVGAPNSFQDLDAAMNHVVDQGLAQIVSNSYGFSGEQVAPGFVLPFTDTLIQAAIQGIGVYFSSGDDSDESQSLGFASADWPASSPWVTAVGGTSIGVGAANDYLFETGWGTGRSTWTGSAWSPAPPGQWTSGAGGGVSVLFPVPSYQAGVVDAVLARYGRSGRAVPDVSALADPSTGYLVGQTQTFPDGTTKYSEYRIGGTSLSCPIFAGIMALADQAKGARHGFANPKLYSVPSSAFHDVQAPQTPVATVRADFNDFVSASSGVHFTLRTFDQTLSLKTGPGYDDVTGRGSPTASFIDALAK